MKQSGIFVLYGESLEEQKFFTMKGIVAIHFLSIYDHCALMVSFHPSMDYSRTKMEKILLFSSYLFMFSPGGQWFTGDKDQNLAKRSCIVSLTCCKHRFCGFMFYSILGIVI